MVLVSSHKNPMPKEQLQINSNLMTFQILSSRKKGKFRDKELRQEQLSMHRRSRERGETRGKG
jgi:hypothetical protein